MGTNVVTGEVKAGREAKYSLASVHSAKKVLSAEGKDGKTYSVDSTEYTVSDIAEFLEIFGGDSDAAFAFASDALTQYAQRSDRSKLSQLCQGPAKIIVRMAKDFMKAPFNSSASDALDMVLNIGVTKNTFTQEYVDANRATLLSKLEKAEADDDAE
jgi:hypothetical protein